MNFLLPIYIWPIYRLLKYQSLADALNFKNVEMETLKRSGGDK
jgi:hypothetical protein